MGARNRQGHSEENESEKQKGGSGTRLDMTNMRDWNSRLTRVQWLQDVGTRREKKIHCTCRTQGMFSFVQNRQVDGNWPASNAVSVMLHSQRSFIGCRGEVGVPSELSQVEKFAAHDVAHIGDNMVVSLFRVHKNSDRRQKSYVGCSRLTKSTEGVVPETRQDSRFKLRDQRDFSLW
jgi:hypothetical protein